jgi:hypothetical protein
MYKLFVLTVFAIYDLSIKYRKKIYLTHEHLI